MRNLAGHPDATAIFRGELAEVSVPVVPSEPHGEVRAEVNGLVDVGGGFVLRVERRWVYAAARLSPPIPIEAAVELNATPFAGAGTKYSGCDGNLGAVARAHGYAGGMGDKMVREWGPLDFWHVDSVEGLGALVAALREVIGRRQITPEDGRRWRVEWETASFLRDAADYLAGTGAIRDIVLDELHGPKLDGSDARIIALRAQYPAPVDPAAPSR